MSGDRYAWPPRAMPARHGNAAQGQQAYPCGTCLFRRGISGCRDGAGGEYRREGQSGSSRLLRKGPVRFKDGFVAAVTLASKSPWLTILGRNIEEGSARHPVWASTKSRDRAPLKGTRRGPRSPACASAATPSGLIGPTRREDRSIGSSRRKWRKITPRRTLKRHRLAKRHQIGPGAPRICEPVGRRDGGNANGAGEASDSPRAL